MVSSLLARIQAILQKEMVREFLGEFMSTYVMMVSGWVGHSKGSP
jgi:aquaporin-7